MVKESRVSTTLNSSSENMSKNDVVPSEVYEQLSKEFLPAVKEVASAGSELLKNYLALEKSSTAYSNALHALARTSRGGSTKAKEFGKELNELVTEYGRAIDFHKTCVKELTSIVGKTSTYAVEEKDKLKEMHSKFQKNEKDLLKHQKKGTKTSQDVETFYETSSREFLRQQELRYKFFLDKHKKWMARYNDLAKRYIGEVDEKPKQEQAEATNKNEQEVVKETDEEQRKLTADSHGKIEEKIAEAAVAEKVTEEDENLTNGGNSSRTSVSSLGKLPSRRQTNEMIPGVVLLNERKIVDEQHVVEERRLTSHSRSSVEHSIPVAAPREDRQDVRSEENTRIKYEYKGPVIVPAPLPRAREPEIVPKGASLSISRANETPIMVPRTIETPIYKPEKPSYPKRNIYAELPPERPHYTVESEYDPSIAPAHRPINHYATNQQDAVLVPSLFKASDYGRTLTVNQDFNATSGEQMTVNKGDRVILIKSGNRGWIFIQDQATQRTGWIPAPFVQF